MAKIIEKSLVIKKETKFDIIRKNLFYLFCKKEYFLLEQVNELMMPKRPNCSKIIIPKEIKR